MLIAKRIGLGIVLIVALAFLAAVVLSPFVRTSILEEYWEVQPAERVKQTDWLDRFEEVAFQGSIVAAGGALVWFLFSSVRYRIKYWETAGGRWPWIIIGAISLILVVALGIFRIAPTVPGDRGDTIAIVYVAILAAAIYWLPTAISSPPASKYAPVFSRQLGRIGNRLLSWN